MAKPSNAILRAREATSSCSTLPSLSTLPFRLQDGRLRHDRLIDEQRAEADRPPELALSHEWLATDQEAYAARQRFVAGFTNATMRFFKQQILTPSDASGVASQLKSTLERCDELTFDDPPAAYAISCGTKSIATIEYLRLWTACSGPGCCHWRSLDDH